MSAIKDLGIAFERIKNLEEERDTAIRERDAAQQDAAQYKKAWERRGLALARPCMRCGYVQHEIKPAAALKDAPNNE